MRFHRGVNAFVVNELPSLMPTIRKFGDSDFVLFSTYKRVGRRPDGIVPTDKAIKIVINNGSLTYSNVSLTALFSDNQDVMQGGERMVHEEGNQAQRTAEVKALALEANKPRIAFVYAGISAFDRAVKFAEGLVRTHNTRVVIVTCDCDLERKRFKLQDKPFDDVIIADWCGGEDDMGELVERLLISA